MGRKLKYTERKVTAYRPGTLQRIKDACGPVEEGTELIRDAVERELDRREGRAELDFELMLRRLCARLRDADDPKIQTVLAQALDLLQRKGTASVLRGEET